jgi:hypothetical protein
MGVGGIRDALMLRFVLISFPRGALLNIPSVLALALALAFTSYPSVRVRSVLHF